MSGMELFAERIKALDSQSLRFLRRELARGRTLAEIVADIEAELAARTEQA